MKIGLRSHNGAEDRLRFAWQIGADGASIWARACPGYSERHFLTADNVREVRKRFVKYELELTGIGLGADCLKNQLLGLPARDRDVEHVCRTIRAIGEAYKDAPQAPVVIIDQRITYWAAGEYPGMHPGFARLPDGRGGAVRTSFDAARYQGKEDRPAGEVSSDEVWSRLAYLYERIVPVAEEAKVRLATHPDDPPLACYRGVQQVLNSFAGLRRLVELAPSPCHGLLFCVGTMQEAGEDVPELMRYFGARQKIFYVHLRNVAGTVPRFTEVFPHEGDSDMIANLKALQETGYQGYLVPDHLIGFDGDSDWLHGSRSWHVGYLRGLMQALGI